MVAYAAAFALCLACARRESRESRGRLFWLASAAIMAFLGVNKQLDLQTWLTYMARDLSLAQGWYEERQAVQVGFIVALAVAGLAVMAALLRAVAGTGPEITCAAAGLVLLGVFVLIRASSFHHVDRLLGIQLASVQLNVILELGGIATVAVSAAVRRLRTR